MFQLRKSLSWLLLAAACISVPQCSSGPALRRTMTLEVGQKIGIAYVPANGSALRMINNSGVSSAEAKAAMAADLSLKVVPDTELQKLLDILGGHGFFDYASPEDISGRTHMVVAHRGGRHILSSRNKVRKATTTFGHCVVEFARIYTANDTLTERKFSADDLKASANKLNRGADKKP